MIDIDETSEWGVRFMLTNPDPAREPSCHTDAEVDAYATRLKAQIDEAVVKMKAELARQARQRWADSDY